MIAKISILSPLLYLPYSSVTSSGSISLRQYSCAMQSPHESMHPVSFCIPTNISMSISIFYLMTSVRWSTAQLYLLFRHLFHPMHIALMLDGIASGSKQDSSVFCKSGRCRTAQNLMELAFTFESCGLLVLVINPVVIVFKFACGSLSDFGNVVLIHIYSPLRKDWCAAWRVKQIDFDFVCAVYGEGVATVVAFADSYAAV